MKMIATPNQERRIQWMAVLALFASLVEGSARVVINEIMYHAPAELDRLQFIELLNDSEAAVDVSGWKFTKGIRFQFPPGSRIPAHGTCVVWSDAKLFGEFYKVPIAGVFEGSLKKKSERIELASADGKVMDTVKYGSVAPWPTAPDGFSASLERISSLSSGDLAENWMSSHLSSDSARPGGSPGKANTVHTTNLPPTISQVTWNPAVLTPDQPLRVEAHVLDLDGVARVRLLYRLVAPGSISEEQAVSMEPAGNGRYAATVPSQPGGRILRLRIQAEDTLGGRRIYPGDNEPRPAISILVQTNFADSALPQIFLIHTLPEEVGHDSHVRPGWGRGVQNPDAMRQRMEWAFRSGLDMSYVWARLTFDLKMPPEELMALRSMFAEQSRVREETAPALSRKVGGEGIEAVRSEIRKQRGIFQSQLSAALKGETASRFEEWWQKEGAKQGVGSRSMSAPNVLKRLWDLERVFATLSQRDSVTRDRFVALRDFFQTEIAKRDALRPVAESLLKEENSMPQIIEKLEPLKPPFEKELEKRFGGDAMSALEITGRPDTSRSTGTPVQGSAAMVYYDPDSKKARVFDFIQINPRAAGWKAHLHKDQSLEGMTTLNLIFEVNERFVIAEPMAFELYRRIGNAACRTDFVRLTIDGDSLGYQLLIEQPNKAFLRHHEVQDGGNLYKLLWYGQGLKGQHEKKTRLREGHEDLEQLMAEIGSKSDPKAQWEAIQKNFDVPQVINYFAVNMCLSYWDGFFNNYFTYHDTAGTGKWTMYPWDQDKTWGFHDGLSGNEVFYDMPITFGTEADRPPGLMGMFMPRGAFGVGHAWWRPGGWFSKPLLSNPFFRKHYLARIKQILETDYVPEKWEPLFQKLEAKLRPEVRYRATLMGEDPSDAVNRLKGHVQTLREHLQKRRQFLLADSEVKSAGAYSWGKGQ